MSNQRHNHEWSGEYAEKFAQSVEKLGNYRYKPFAKEVLKAIEMYGTKENLEIIDLGSGPGNLLVELHELCGPCKLTGIDSSKKMLELAKKKLETHKITKFELKQGSAENIPIETNTINAVVCLNSFHDFRDSKQTIKEVSRILTKDGLFILKDKNGTYPKWKIRFLFIPLIVKIGLKQTLSYFKSNILWLNPDEVIEWMSESGLKVKEVHYKLDYLIIGKKI